MGAIDLMSFLLSAVVQAALLVLLGRRHLYRRGMFPFFFIYTLYSVSITVPRLLLLHRPAQYPGFYWGTEIIYGVLALLSINEVFGRTFFLDYQEQPSIRFAFPVTVLLIMVGLLVWWRFIYQTPTGGHLGLFSSVFVAFNQGVHSIEGILLVLFVVLWLMLAPGWKRYDYGILLGFGFSGLIIMTTDMIRFEIGLSHAYQLWYMYAPGTAYALVTVVWLYSFWPAPAIQRRSPMRFRAVLEQARRNNEMIKLIHEWIERRRSRAK